MATTIFGLVKKPAKGYIPGAVLADLHKELSEPDSEFAFTVPRNANQNLVQVCV